MGEVKSAGLSRVDEEEMAGVVEGKQSKSIQDGDETYE